MFNRHTHTKRSHDSRAELTDICEYAIKAGLEGFSVTDHLDSFDTDRDHFTQFELCRRDCEAAREKYGDKIKIQFGIEVGDAMFAPDYAKKVIASQPFEIVLMSVHSVRYKGLTRPFSLTDFSDADEDFLNSYMAQYFEDLYESVMSFDFDVLCHLTVPLRYIERIYKKNIELERFYPAMERIMLETIKRGKAFEINTAGVTPDDKYFVPEKSVIDLYTSLGGRLFSIGSDAHSAERVANGLEEGKELALSVGGTIW